MNELMNVIEDMKISELAELSYIGPTEDFNNAIIKVIASRLSKESKYDEKILVLPSTLLDRRLGDLNGLLLDNDKANEIYELIDTIGRKMKRSDVEYDYRYRQIITQFIITCGTEIFVAQKKKGDSRLLEQYEIVGGHLNGDTDNMYNELYEEIDFSNIIESDLILPICKGIIKITKPNDVGNYHLGLIFHVELPNRNISIHPDEEHKLSGEWVDILELEDMENKNSWLELISDNIGDILREKILI